MNAVHLFTALFLTSVIFLLPFHMNATTCSGTISVWPNDSLPINGQIILTGSLEYDEVVENIAHYHPRLVSENHAVVLIAESRHRSRQGMAQVVLAPAELLHQSMTYRLEIDSNALLYESNSFSDADEFMWTVTGKRDATNPRWVKNPTGIRADTDGRFGYFFVLETEIRDEEPYVIEVELKAPGEDLQRFILTYFHYDETTKLYQFGIGQNECAGSFSVREGDQYRARFIAMDAAGNRALCPQSCVLIFAGEKIEEETDKGWPGWYSTTVSQEDCARTP